MHNSKGVGVSLLSQSTPSPSNPVLQVHSRLPSVLIQFACSLHPPLLTSHSSISVYATQVVDKMTKYIHTYIHTFIEQQMANIIVIYNIVMIMMMMVMMMMMIIIIIIIITDFSFGSAFQRGFAK